MALSVACTRPPEQVAQPATQAAPDAGVVEPPRSPFYVVAEGGEGTPEYHSSLHLCVVDSTVFICGSGLVFKQGRFMADSGELSEGGYRGAPPVGHLPDDVWRVDVDKDDPDRDPRKLAVYRFSQGHWRKAGALGPGYEFRAFAIDLSSWTPGRVLVLDRFIDKDGQHRSVFKTFGEGRAPPLPRSTAREEPYDFRAFADGSVVALSHDLIEIWTDTAKAPRRFELDCGGLTWHASSAAEIVVFGDTGPRERRQVCGQRISANGVERIASVDDIEGHPSSYAQEPNGREWLVVGSGESSQYDGWSRATLWQRRAGDPWQRVELPVALFSKAKEVALKPLQVFAPGNDEIWIKAHYREKDGFDQGVILHNRAPAAVCRYVEKKGKGLVCQDP